MPSAWDKSKAGRAWKKQYNRQWKQRHCGYDFQKWNKTESGKTYHAQYNKKHPWKKTPAGKAYHKRYNQQHPEVKARYKTRVVTILKDSYVRDKLTGNLNGIMRQRDWPPMLVKAKRELLKLRRILNEST